jgi:uncharacterized protein YdbL (DUF1318 family)
MLLHQTPATMHKHHLVLCLSTALLLASTMPAAAQSRDPAYAEARAQGQVGEQVNGYLGFVTPPTAELRKVVEDINIKRRAVYADKAKTTHATIEEYALTTGCMLITHTVPGEKYQAPSGAWETRSASAPQRDPRCP